MCATILRSASSSLAFFGPLPGIRARRLIANYDAWPQEAVPQVSASFGGTEFMAWCLRCLLWGNADGVKNFFIRCAWVSIRVQTDPPSNGFEPQYDAVGSQTNPIFPFAKYLGSLGSLTF